MPGTGERPACRAFFLVPAAAAGKDGTRVGLLESRTMETPPTTRPAHDDEMAAVVAARGYAFVPAAVLRARLEACGSLRDWTGFAASWNQLPVDTYMADHGRYRRRRHAVYAIDARGTIARCPHQPHFQAIDYNPLNGGIERWFEPVLPDIGASASMQAILRFCSELFAAVAGDHSIGWQVEVHQFRIEARANEPGLPTPEGMHRDGVDYVLVLLVGRCNIGSGTTLVGSPSGSFESSFTLVDAFDAALVDDHRVHHGVTAVEALDPSLPAYRDVVVVTLRRQ